MPRVRRKDLPPLLLRHLLDRVNERHIDAKQLELLAAWLDGEPEVPEGPWYKDFGSFKLCGEGKDPKTFLLRGQPAQGQRDCLKTTRARHPPPPRGPHLESTR